jgi:prevent-host-death family protein
MTIPESTMGAYSVAEAKARLSEILTRVEAGQEVTITRRGQAVAAIVPIRERQKKAIDWKAIEAFRKTLPKSRTSAAELVREMRDAGF